MEAKTCALSKILEADKEEARKQKEISGLRRGFFPPMKKTQSSSKSQPKSKVESQKKLQAQSQIGDYTDAPKWSLHSDDQQEFDAVLTLSFVLSKIPLKMVESPGIQVLLNYLCPKATIKSSTTLANYKLPMLYKNIEKHVQEQLDEDIPNSKIVAFTRDGWTARNNDPYESLTVHYCNKGLELKKLTLDCQNFIGRKNGIKLAQGLDNMINKFPILAGDNLRRVCVTDGASNIKSAATQSRLVDQHMLCVDHIMNLCLQVNIFN